jgi:hypothetical protein
MSTFDFSKFLEAEPLETVKPGLIGARKMHLVFDKISSISYLH